MKSAFTNDLTKPIDPAAIIDGPAEIYSERSVSRIAGQDWLTRQLGITFPYVSFGKVDSLDLFGPNELVIFAIYEANRKRYKKALDIGANIGLHTILMCRQGWEIKAFEPDPEHFERLQENCRTNECEAELVNAAVSKISGEFPFTRVLDNSTGSHLAEYKHPHGPIDFISVETVSAKPLFTWAQFAKIDAEGAEADIIECLDETHRAIEIVAEVGNKENAERILSHCSMLHCGIYTQKTNWELACSINHMPHHHSEGSIWISSRGGPFDDAR